MNSQQKGKDNMTSQQQSRNLIIHADDGGLCHSVNQAIIEALKSGIVTSTSLMVPCPAFDEIAEYFKENPYFDVGIHFTLTCGYLHKPWGPIAGKNNVPSLVNSKGYFLGTVDEVIANATLEDLETELRAQIKHFLKSGLEPTHLDSHRGILFQNFRLLEIFIKLGIEHKIPPLLLKPTESTFKTAEEQGIKLDLKRIKMLMAMGLPFLDQLFMIAEDDLSFNERENQYIQTIKRLPLGVSQIIIHPGYDDEELNRLTANGKCRNDDLIIFTDSRIKQLIEENNINILGWKEFSRLSRFGV
jgi:predicted glycoside hydrolase/deacetylase ChbG (UPF0249 family)